MAGHMGSTTRRFFDVHEELVDNVQRKMVEYIKTLQPSSNIQQDLSHPVLLLSSKNGYPWLPPTVSDFDGKKDELEKLVRTYLNNHYSEFAFPRGVMVIYIFGIRTGIWESEETYSI